MSVNISKIGLAVGQAASTDESETRHRLTGVEVYESGLAVATDGRLLASGADSEIADSTEPLAASPLALLGRKAVKGLLAALRVRKNRRSLPGMVSVHGAAEDTGEDTGTGIPINCGFAVSHRRPGDVFSGVSQLFCGEATEELVAYPKWNRLKFLMSVPHSRPLVLGVPLLEKILRAARDAGGAEWLELDIPESEAVFQVGNLVNWRLGGGALAGSGELFGVVARRRAVGANGHGPGPIERRLYDEATQKGGGGE